MISQRRYEDRGPTSSKDYNDRIRETTNSYLDLLGRVTAAQADVTALATLSAVESAATSGLYETLLANYETLNASTDTSTVCGLFNDIVVKSLAGHPSGPTDSEALVVNPLELLPEYGMIVMPSGGHISKLGYQTSEGWIIDPAIKVVASLDTSGTVGDPYRAIDHDETTALVARTTTTGTRTLSVYVSLPGKDLVNYIDIDPSPRNAQTLKRICISTVPGATLDENNPTQWTDIWASGDTDIPNKRFRSPQSNGANAQSNCGKRRYYFGERRVTAVKIVLESNKSFTIDAQPEVFLGIRNLDVGHVSFAKTGRIVLEVDLPAVRSISDVDARIANLGGDATDGAGTTVPTIALYRLQNSTWMSYTMGVDVGAGNEMSKVRVELSMTLPSNGCTPVLAGLVITHA